MQGLGTVKAMLLKFYEGDAYRSLDGIMEGKEE